MEVQSPRDNINPALESTKTFTVGPACRFLSPRQSRTRDTSESAAFEGERFSSDLDHPSPFWLILDRM